jgi:hypothetical protein
LAYNFLPLNNHEKGWVNMRLQKNQFKYISVLVALLAFGFKAVVSLAGDQSAEMPKVMLVTAADGEENSEWNEYIKQRLEAWGYSVDKLHTRLDVLDYEQSDYALYDFIFLSETLDSRVPGMDKLKNIPLPMVNSDGWAAKEAVFGFGSEQGIHEPTVPSVILNAAENHALSAGISTEESFSFGTSGRKDCLLVWTKPAVEVTAIAAVASNPEQIVVYGLEKGAKNMAGEAISNRVATIGTHAWCYDNLSDSSEELFKAAINWVLEE